MISEGSGGKRFSSAIREAAPIPPSASMTLTAQPATPPRSEAFCALAVRLARVAPACEAWGIMEAVSSESRGVSFFRPAVIPRRLGVAAFSLSRIAGQDHYLCVSSLLEENRALRAVAGSLP